MPKRRDIEKTGKIPKKRDIEKTGKMPILRLLTINYFA